MIEGLCDFMNWSYSWYVTTLPSSLPLLIVVVVMFLVCHVISQDHVRKGPFAYIDRSPSIKSATCHVWWRFNGFSLSRDLAKGQRVMWLYGQEPIKVSYHLAMFCGHRHSGSRNIFLVCHMILQNHLIRGSCNFLSGVPYGKSPPCQDWWP